MIDARLDSKTERREYYRVDDNAIFQYRMLPEEEVKIIKERGVPLELDNFSIYAKLDHITHEARPLLKAIEVKDSKLAAYLALIDKKLELLSRISLENDIYEVGGEAQEINLSTGGLSFEAGNKIELGSMMKLKIVFLPDRIGASSYAKVVKCIQHDDKYQISVSFEYMGDEVRDLISRHILHKDRIDIHSNRR